MTHSLPFLRPVLGAALLSAMLLPAAAQETKTQATLPDPGILRICASEIEAPYSSKDGSGFENKAAAIIAKTMGRKPVFVWTDQPAIYLVRDWLDKQRCDVVMGLDAGDERVLTTTPYYRSGYVFVTRADTKLNIQNWKSEDLVEASHIGFVPGTPVQTMMEQVGLFNVHFNYMHSLTDFKDRRNKYTRIDPRRMVREVKEGKADVAVHFGPDIARYVKAEKELRLVLIPDDNVAADGRKIPHHFDQSIAVRKGDTQLLGEIEAALAKAKPEIEAVLKDEGFPLIAQPSRS
ncbi:MULTISPECIES: methanol oxidation system protein MoxJ [Rhodomicrobium]|uniref:methanol oxidation system protein MoxJ n=1 Tax=Rhodomicrobium TaxID=1068 RepID=UPI000B4B0A9C|nr:MULTISPECIES: methanol oxidation system protein MoxJ [Rhodomicrobium]